MANQRRRFLGLAAGAIAVPATSSLVVAQGDPSRGREAPILAQASVPERRPAKSELTGLSALLTPEECVVLLIDHQPFQFANLHSHEPTMIVNNVTGLAKFAKAFNVPVILTTVLEARGGTIIKGLQDVFPNQKSIDRTYINAWQDKRIVDLVKGTGRKKLVMAALWTEMCLAMPTIHALGEGYDVYIVTDASGGVSAEAHDMAVRRMGQAGAVPSTWIGLSGGWQSDWARESTLPDTVKIIAAHGGGSGGAFALGDQLLGACNAVGLRADGEAAWIVVPPATEAVSPFSISLPKTAIDDLRHRLDSTRYPERETVGDWTQGVPLGKARALIEYWRNRYDWRRFEARANSFPHFPTRIDWLGIDFVHARSSHTNAMPLVFTHAWHGSFVEFLEVIGPLTEPTRFGGNADDAFHVVVPSLPGFALSDKPSKTGWDVERIAQAWVTLMQRLGYERWVAQGGDWGSGVTHALARLRPPGLIAAHVNWPFVFPSKLPENPTPAEKRAFERAAWFQGEQSGYFREQATRPPTNGYALAHSAARQALWIYHRFQAWTDNRGIPHYDISIDAMLDDIR